jgi:hypothetical protein
MQFNSLNHFSLFWDTCLLNLLFFFSANDIIVVYINNFYFNNFRLKFVILVHCSFYNVGFFNCSNYH